MSDKRRKRKIIEAKSGKGNRKSGLDVILWFGLDWVSRRVADSDTRVKVERRVVVGPKTSRVEK
jgi:hypothetical protein